MTVSVYRSTDGGAPSLTNGLGTLIGVLDYVLLSSGWTKPFTGVNLAAYKQGAGSNGFYLRIDDTGADAPAGSSARVTGYETMSDVNTGTGRFPAVGQGVATAGYAFWLKSNNASPISWMAIATESFVWLWARVTTSACAVVGFGDINSKVSGDVYNTVMIGNILATPASFSNQLHSVTATNMPALAFSGTNGTFIARQSNQTGTSQTIQFSLFSSDKRSAAAGGLDDIGMDFPHFADGSIYISTLEVAERPGATVCWRGTLPGIYFPCHAGSAFLTNGAQLTIGGKTLEARYFTPGTPALAWVLFEVSDTW